MVLGGCCLKIKDVCMHFEPCFKVHNLVSVHPNSIILGQMINLDMIFHVVMPVYRLVKIWNLPQFPVKFRNGLYYLPCLMHMHELSPIKYKVHITCYMVKSVEEPSGPSGWRFSLVSVAWSDYKCFIYSHLNGMLPPELVPIYTLGWSVPEKGAFAQKNTIWCLQPGLKPIPLDQERNAPTIRPADLH